MAKFDDHIAFIRLLARDMDEDLKNEGDTLNMDLDEWLLFMKRFTYADGDKNMISLLDCAIEFCAIRAAHYSNNYSTSSQMSLATRRELMKERAEFPDKYIYESSTVPFEG